MSEIASEETVTSTTVFDGKLISVNQVTVRLPDGRTTVREVVHHPEVVAVLPRLDDGRIVMVRQFRKAVERILLEVPAGGIDGEESPEQAVRREMIEETGYRAGSLRHLASFYTSPGFCTELVHLYEATDLQPGTATEETDQLEVMLVSPEEARALLRSDSVDAKTLLALSYL